MPFYKEQPKTLTCFQKSKHQLEVEQENPYNRIIAREVLNWLNHSKMVAIFHLNSINSDDFFNARVALHKQNMQLKVYGKKIISMAVEGTKFETIEPLFDSNHCIVFSSEEQVSKLLRLTKKVPQMVLMAGIVQNRLLSRNEFTDFASLPDLTTARAQLVGTLNMAGGKIVEDLEAHSKNLVNILDIHAKGDQ
ncbi:hypothetical protein ACFFRR_007534 [Megaselia abdita]